jgi:hypothetical protein
MKIAAAGFSLRNHRSLKSFKATGERIMDEERWEVVHTTSGMTHASIVVGRLETEGIPTRLKYEAVGTIYGITINGLGQVDILVPEQLLERTRDILSRSYDEADLDWESC